MKDSLENEIELSKEMMVGRKGFDSLAQQFHHSQLHHQNQKVQTYKIKIEKKQIKEFIRASTCFHYEYHCGRRQLKDNKNNIPL